MRNLILELGMLLLCSTLVLASEKATNLNETDQKLAAPSLSELAASADLVAVAPVPTVLAGSDVIDGVASVAVAVTDVVGSVVATAATGVAVR